MIRSLIVAAALVGAASSTVSVAHPVHAMAAPRSAAGVPLSASTLGWHPCDTQYRCATLSVPIDYAHPASGNLPLAVVELASTGAHPLGDLVLNPGGPGESGVTFLEQDSIAFAALRKSFNLVSFDPRGVGASDPVSCGSAAQIESWVAANPSPSGKAEINAAIAEAKSFVAACEKGTPRAVLDHVGTDETVNDMERLRIALGDPKLTFLGFSYGSYLGERYAQRYPTHVRAMVLDGVVDPALGIEAVDEQQVEAFERDLSAFSSWCSANHNCKTGLPGGATAAYNTLLGRLAHGATIKANIGPGNAKLPPLNLALAQLGVIASLYTPTSWAFLGTALAQALGGNGSDLSELAVSYEGIGGTGGSTNVISANSAISCEDSGALGATSDYAPFAKKLALVSPHFGAANAWSSFLCRYWPVGPSEHPQAIHAPGSPQILVVGSTQDPATPYAWAKSVASELDHGVLLTRSGYGHTAYFASSCVMTDVDRYLVDLAVPRPATVCASD